MLLLTIAWLGATTIIGVPSATTVLVAVGCPGVGVVVVTVLVGCPVDVGVGVTVVPVAVGVLVPVGVAVPLMGVPLVAVAVLVLVGDVPLPTLVAVGVGVALIVGVSVVMLAALVGNVAVGVALYVSLVLVVVAVLSDAGYASMIVGVSVGTPPPWTCGGTIAVGVWSPANGSTVLVGVWSPANGSTVLVGVWSPGGRSVDGVVGVNGVLPSAYCVGVIVEPSNGVVPSGALVPSGGGYPALLDGVPSVGAVGLSVAGGVAITPGAPGVASNGGNGVPASFGPSSREATSVGVGVLGGAASVPCCGVNVIATGAPPTESGASAPLGYSNTPAAPASA
jgi:hypothetical protein